MKKKAVLVVNINKQIFLSIFYILVIMQPVIDILTGQFAEHLTDKITIGIIFRVLLIAVIITYLFKYFSQNQLNMLGLFLTTLLLCLVTFLTNLAMKKQFYFFQEVQFLFKTFYFICITFMTYALIKQQTMTRAFILHTTQIVAVIVSASYWIALVTNTSMASYSYNSAGYSGWFFATNELSVTIIILCGLTIAYLDNHFNQLSAWVAFISILFISPMIGTKTAFLGCIIVLFIYTFSSLIWKKGYNRIKLLIVTIIYCIVLPFTPIVTNLTNDYSPDTTYKRLKTPEDAKHLPNSLQRLLSSRNHYFVDTYIDYMEAHPVRKIFGLGFAGDYEKDPKTIEMDFFDLFFSYGLLGTIFLLIPLLLIIVQIIVQLKNEGISLQNITLTLVFFLSLAIGFIAGHVIFAPSVISYVMLAVLAIGLKKDWRTN